VTLQALVGFTREIIHLDGRTVKLHREAVVQPAAIWPIPGEGIPRRNLPGEFGSLLVHFNIAYPTELDAAAKAGKDCAEFNAYAPPTLTSLCFSRLPAPERTSRAI
jgi:DnaJ-class molecular chaperone